MAREELQLEAKRFTTASALAREVLYQLDNSDCKVIVLVNEKGLEQIARELEGRVTMGRVKVVRLEEEEPLWQQQPLQTL
jgi:hypothetical protein